MEDTREQREPCCDSEKCPAYRYCWDDKDNKFPPIRTFFLVGAFFFYLVDVGLDIWVAIEHYVAIRDGTDENARYYLPATLFFIIVPLLIINFLSWMLYTWGWLMYRSPRIRNYCDQQSEPLTYVKFSENGPRTEVNVHSIQVISWSWYKSSRERRTRRSISRSMSPRSPTSPSLQNHIELHELPTQSNYGHVKESVEAVFDRDAPKSSDCWEAGETEERGGIIGLPSPQSHARKGSTVPILEDYDHDSPDGVQFYPLDLFDNYEYLIVSLIHLLQFGYIFRVLRLLYKRKQDSYSFDRYRDLSFLRLMESFLESAPQVVLQLYIVVIKEEARLSYNIVTPISIIVSVCSLALAVADYISSTKDLDYYDPPPDHDRRPRLSWTAYFIIILWHLCMIAGRTVSFALFASIYGGYMFVVLGLHYFAMVYWSYWQQAHVFIRPSTTGAADKTRNKRNIYQRRSLKSCLDPRNHICGNYGIEFIIAAFNIFFHFKIRDGGSSLETLVPFYSLTFVENTLMIFLWYFARDTDVAIWYGVPSVVMVFVTFFAGIVLLIIYYNFFQPQYMDSLEPNPDIRHPTMTCTLNRLYIVKQRRGSVFQRIVHAEKVSAVIRRLSN